MTKPININTSMTSFMCAVKSNSIQDVATKEEICVEQTHAMKEWVMSRMPSKLLPYFENVKNPWDRTEVILSCIRDLNYKDIILKPTIDEFRDEMIYEPYFKLNSLASLLGYSKPADLFNSGKVLSIHQKYTLKNLKDNLTCTRQNGDYANSIIPEHLDNKSDPRNNDYIYIDMAACEDLISAAMKQSKFREKAIKFRDTVKAIKDINDIYINTINKEMVNYINKLNTGKMPTTEERSLVKSICAVKSNSPNIISTSSEEHNTKIDTKNEIRELVINKIPDQLKPYLEGISDIWDREAIIRTNIERLGYKDIIMKPELNLFGDVTYQGYCRLSTFANTLGYDRPDVLFTKNNILAGYQKYVLSDLNVEIKPQGTLGSYRSIIPSHLNCKSDRNRNNYTYIDMDTANVLINAAMRRAKMKDQAKAFDEALKMANMISTSLIDKLTRLCDEYRYQQRDSDRKRLELYDARKQEMDTALRLAIAMTKDVEMTKKHHMYIFTTPHQEEIMLYKFGITDNLDKRLVSLQNGDSTNGGDYVHTTDVYNNKWSEKFLHQVLSDIGMHSDGEWYRTPGRDASIKLLDTLSDSMNDAYDVALEFPQLIRAKLINRLAIEDIDMNGKSPSLPSPPPINDYVLDVLNKIKDNKSISKTNMNKLLKLMSNDARYKKHKDKLPIDLDEFMKKVDELLTNNDNNSNNHHNIKLNKETLGKRTTITIIKITIEDDGNNYT